MNPISFHGPVHSGRASSPVTFRSQLAPVAPSQPLPEDTAVFSPQRPGYLSLETLEDTIRPSVALLYGEQNADVISEHIKQMVERLYMERPVALKEQDRTRKPDWYKNLVMYSLYADAFATDGKKKATFDTLAKHLGYLRRLGVDTVHVLPFLDSPMVDAGFDISNYTHVRKDLGGNDAFKRFMTKAKENNLNVMMDMVLNHASDQHPDFQAALKGDLDKIARFIYRREKPESTRLNIPGEGVVIEYKDGTRIRLQQSDNAETHYSPSMVNGKPRYFYSTYMPQQKDWNWNNPDVLYEHLKNIGYWANQGVDIFRLDALAFLVKEPGTTGENTLGTHAIVKILSACLQVMAPSTVLLAEAAMPPNELLKYYGQERQILNNNQLIPRTDEVQMTYNFPLMSSIWTALVTQDSSPILKTLAEGIICSDSATQVNFLRVHDELSMESVNATWQKAVYDKLDPKGAGMRGGIGIAGRIANFTDNNPRQAALLYSTLFSLPGIPLVYYGDELMAQNNPQYLIEAAQRRAIGAGALADDFKKYIDNRDLNRGPLTAAALKQIEKSPNSPGGQLFRELQRMIAIRKKQPALYKGSLTPVPAKEASTLSYIREFEDQRVLVIENLSDQPVESTLQLPNQALATRVALKTPQDLLSERDVPLQVEPKNNQVQLHLEPYQAYWLKLN